MHLAEFPESGILTAIMLILILALCSFGIIMGTALDDDKIEIVTEETDDTGTTTEHNVVINNYEAENADYINALIVLFSFLFVSFWLIVVITTVVAMLYIKLREQKSNEND